MTDYQGQIIELTGPSEGQVIGTWEAYQVTKIDAPGLDDDSIVDFACTYIMPGYVSPSYIVRHRLGDGPGGVAALALHKGHQIYTGTGVPL
jgi:hypothetical protein